MTAISPNKVIVGTSSGMMRSFDEGEELYQHGTEGNGDESGGSLKLDNLSSASLRSFRE